MQAVSYLMAAATLRRGHSLLSWWWSTILWLLWGWYYVLCVWSSTAHRGTKSEPINYCFCMEATVNIMVHVGWYD